MCDVKTGGKQHFFRYSSSSRAVGRALVRQPVALCRTKVRSTDADLLHDPGCDCLEHEMKL